jgi:small subunit ribosomal protein S7
MEGHNKDQNMGLKERNNLSTMSKKRIRKRELVPDPLYEDELVSRFINHVMRKGKKSLACKIVYKAFDIVKQKTKKDPLEIFGDAITNASPRLEVRPRRVGGATYQVPLQVNGDRKITLAMRWIVEAAKSKKGKPMQIKLADELIAASQKTGDAIKKKESLRKLAEANRAFAHLAW